MWCRFLQNPVVQPENWGRNVPAFNSRASVRDHQRPSFPEYREYPYVSADEVKKALRL